MKTSFKIKKIIFGLLGFLTINTSCKKLIEIPKSPPNAIEQSEIFADSVTAVSAVAGTYVYTSIAGAGFGFRDGTFTLLTGLSSDELVSNTATNAAIIEVQNNSVESSNTYTGGLWDNAYSSLYDINVCINGITASPSLSVSLKNQLIGELKVSRALYYFNLVNLFGGVPLITSTDFKTTSVQARASIDDLYTQIINDLTDASHKLTAHYPTTDKARPNLYVAESLLAKVYLYRGQWQNAYNAASAVINSGNYTLEPDLTNVFLAGSTEAIWQLPVNILLYATSDAAIFVPYAIGVAPSYSLNGNLLAAFEPGDKRMSSWVGFATAKIAGTPQTLSYPYKYKNRTAGSKVEDYMILRLGELYLIRAEAAAQLNNFPVASSDLNIVRNRAGLANTTAATQTDFATAILHERQTELFCEWGNRWYDLKRTSTVNVVLGAEKTNWTTNAALYPIPLTQIQTNPQLTQNPGY